MIIGLAERRAAAAAIAAACLAAAAARAADPTNVNPATTVPATTQPAPAAQNPVTGSTTVSHDGTADATPKVDNPMCAGWAKFKVGSTATYAMDMTVPGGQAIKGTGTLTLRSTGATGATLDQAAVIAGQAMPPNPATFPTTVDAAAVKRTGTADVVAMGKTFKCDVYDCTQAAFGQRAGTGGTMTVYLSPDVPGGMVKAVAQQPGQPTGTLTLTAMSAK